MRGSQVPSASLCSKMIFRGGGRVDQFTNWSRKFSTSLSAFSSLHETKDKNIWLHLCCNKRASEGARLGGLHVGVQQQIWIQSFVQKHRKPTGGKVHLAQRYTDQLSQFLQLQLRLPTVASCWNVFVKSLWSADPPVVQNQFQQIRSVCCKSISPLLCF